MTQKIIRDPLYNYISIDIAQDGWILDLLNAPEIQRLRFIHQLGVSSLTYPGADHSRLSHSLGVLHLMKIAVDHLSEAHGKDIDDTTRKSLLAAAILHDAGHGPYSHVLESAFGTDHEKWSVAIIEDEGTVVNRVLKQEGLVDSVAALIRKDDYSQPYWQKALLSSQVDVDRMDYLRRDSHFSGADYGRFDWYRILHSMKLVEHPAKHDVYLAWPEKSKFALEEYIFARFYMYQNVYFHHCTRGYERILNAVWTRAKALCETDPDQVDLLPPVRAVLAVDNPPLSDYLQLGEYHILSQLQAWLDSKDSVLKDLSKRFLSRQGFAAVELEAIPAGLSGFTNIENARGFLRQKKLNPDYYLLDDDGKTGIYNAYHPEKETDLEDPITAILLHDDTWPGSGFQEVSNVLLRIKAVSETVASSRRYYFPKEYRAELKALLSDA